MVSHGPGECWCRSRPYPSKFFIHDHRSISFESWTASLNIPRIDKIIKLRNVFHCRNILAMMYLRILITTLNKKRTNFRQCESNVKRNQWEEERSEFCIVINTPQLVYRRDTWNMRIEFKWLKWRSIEEVNVTQQQRNVELRITEENGVQQIFPYVVPAKMAHLFKITSRLTKLYVAESRSLNVNSLIENCSWI
jgi:hypothetical protein